MINFTSLARRAGIAALAAMLLAVLIGTATGSTAYAAVPACRTSGTSAAVSPAPGGGYAGGYHYRLTITNTGSYSCYLRGWAGVSMVTGDSGTQVGAAAVWVGTVQRSVTLAPGARTSADLQITNAQNYSASYCRPTRIRGFRVYVPNSYYADFAPQTAPLGCWNSAVKLMRLQPFG